MLARLTPGTNRSNWGTAELPWEPINRKATPVRGVNFDHVFIVAYLRMVAGFVETHHGTVGYFSFSQPDHPPGCGSALEPRLQNFVECGAIFDSPSIAVKALVAD